MSTSTSTSTSSRNHLRTHLRTWLSSLCFVMSLLALRALLIQELELGVEDAYRQGLVAGIFADLSLALIPLSLGLFAAAPAPRSRHLVQGVTGLVAYTAVLSNACYFIFFRRPLELSIVGYGSKNVWELRGIATHFLTYRLIQVSLAFFLVGLIGQFWITRSREAAASSPEQRRSENILRTLVTAGAVFVLALFVRQAPVWFKAPRLEESPLSYNIAWRWFKNWKKERVSAELLEQLRIELPEAPGKLTRLMAMSGDEYPPAAKAAPSLLREFHAPQAEVRTLRQKLGLGAVKKPNVIMLFLESARAFELVEPRIGPEVYPNLRKVLDTRALFFSQAYASANFTVEGQFASLCSAWDRMEGPPVYASTSNLKIRCLPQLLVENGYETYWMNPFHRFFSGKYIFESMHGTRHFLDQEVFKAHTDEEQSEGTHWGLSDRLFLEQAFDRLTEVHSHGNPFFANVLTVGTHAPWTPVPGSEVSPELKRLTESVPNHHAYLSRVKALDRALGRFFDRFFTSPMADDTVVVLLSDHGTGVVPAFPRLSPLQQRLLWPRILLAVIGKNVSRAERLPYPVNQVDVAPLVATLTDSSGPVTWVGRNPMQGSGTPWASRISNRLTYRTATRLCSELSADARMRCWSLESGQDPLLVANPAEKPEDPRLSAELREAIRAGEILIEGGDFSYHSGTASQL